MDELSEYRRLIEENHNLIYAFMQKHHLSEDWYGDCAVGLCKAAKIFDESKGYKFSTVAYRIMYNEMAMRYRDHENKRIPAASLNSLISDDSDDEYNSLIPDRNDHIAVAEDLAMIRWMLAPTRLTDLMIIWYRMNDMTHEEIGELVGVTQPQVSRRLKQLKRCFYERRRFAYGSKNYENDPECAALREKIFERLEEIGRSGQ